MHAVEFTADLGAGPILRIPEDAASQLPKTGKARILVLTANGAEAAEWRLAAYEQFMREDSPEDAVYDS